MANGASAGAALDDNSEDPIDLTSDTEASPLPGGGASAAAASSSSNGGGGVGIESAAVGLKLMAAVRNEQRLANHVCPFVGRFSSSNADRGEGGKMRLSCLGLWPHPTPAGVWRVKAAEMNKPVASR